MTNYHIWKDVTNDTWNWLLHHTGQKSKEDEWWKGDSEVGEGKENGEKMIKKVKEEGKHHLHFFFFSLVSAYICSFVSCMNHYFLQVPSGVEEVKKKTDWMQFNNTQNYYVIHVQFFKKNNDQILTQFHQTSQ